MDGNADAPVLEARELRKQYGAVVAIDGVDLRLKRGETVALIGDNGAGKSTLINMLCGALQPDQGAIWHRGEEVQWGSPQDARMAGIETVYQDLALAPELDVVGNLFLGREIVRTMKGWPQRFSILNNRAMKRLGTEKLKEIGIDLPMVQVGRMSGGQRQAVAVARAAAWASDVLFMDEPTAALGVRQARSVLALARGAAERGLAVVVITHSLPQVMEVAERVVVLRRGKIVGDVPASKTSQEKLISLMIGGS